MIEDANQPADRAIDFVEAQADLWAERVNLAAMIENATSPMRLNRNAPEDVRSHFHKRMREQIDAIVRQAFMEGWLHVVESLMTIKKHRPKQ